MNYGIKNEDWYIIEMEIQEDIFFGYKQLAEEGITEQELVDSIQKYLNEGETSWGNRISKRLKRKYWVNNVSELWMLIESRYYFM